MTHSLTGPDRTQFPPDPEFVAAFTAAISFIKSIEAHHPASTRPDGVPPSTTGRRATTSADDDHWLPGVF